MSRKRYVTVSVPVELSEIVSKVVKSKKYGYISVSEFVKESIRERLRELGYFGSIEMVELKGELEKVKAELKKAR